VGVGSAGRGVCGGLVSGDAGVAVVVNEPLTPIGAVRVYCPACGWTGRVNDCEPDVDGDGSLGCPRCRVVVKEAGS